MVKAQDFLRYLCGVLEYRFLSGLNCSDLKAVYDNLDPNIMHYIPAVTPETALGMAIGVSIGNIKAAIFLTEAQFERIKYKLKNIDLENELQIIIIIVDNIDYKSGVKGVRCFKVKDNFVNALKRANSFVTKEKIPCVLSLDKGFLV